MRILFLCTLNAVRSPIAAAMGKKYFPEHEFFSAGLEKGPQDFLAIEVMNEVGIDISAHQPKVFTEISEKIDLVICLAYLSPEEIKMLEQKGWKPEFWEVPSPGLVRGSRIMKLFGYRDIRDKIKSKIRSRFHNIPA